MKQLFAQKFNQIERENRKKFSLSSSQNLIIRKNVLVNVYRKMIAKGSLVWFTENDKRNIDLLKVLLQKKPSRNISGITSITIIVHGTTSQG